METAAHLKKYEDHTHMNRKEMVKERMEKLSGLSDEELVRAVVSYFGQNATMPGEKAVKDNASDLLAMFKVKPGHKLTGCYRKELIEEFASLCIKEVKLKNVTVKNETKQNADHGGLKAGDLPMVLIDTRFLPENSMKNVYEMSGMISGDEDGHRFVKIYDTGTGCFEFASLPDGFQKNHTLQHGMDITVIATDYSNGKFANMSYTLLIDLGQRIVA